jgi:hypothetical protein
VYIDGQKYKTLTGPPDQLAREFRQIVDDYVATKYGEAETVLAGKA